MDDNNLAPLNIESNRPPISLPPTWFESRITLEQIRSCFRAAQKEIRIASGFFTIKGWGLIRNTTDGKRVYLLVGIDEPGEERARAVLVKEILRDLATGRDRGRRTSVQDLVQKIESGSLRMVDARATSHHGKLYIVDRAVAIVASANTTGRGFLDQKEAGGLYGYSLIERFIEESSPEIAITPEIIEALHRFIENQVANYIYKFDEYFAIANDITQELLITLKRWLKLASPWDIYLKTLLALEEITHVKSSYNKSPVSYQQDMIAQTLRQIREHGGSMLVASTGLGKTVVGVHVAIHLKAEDIIDKVIVICPNAVQSTWKREMRDASIFSEYFNLEILDRKDFSDAHALENWEEICQSMDRHRWLLIFDESHKLRKRYPGNYQNRKYRQEAKKERKAFTRLLQIVKSGEVKVLLLTGSPYATDIDNINTQLLLLPHTNESHALLPELVDGQAWRVDDTDEFINLPVASQLTTPHVAKYYGRSDSDGIYINFNEAKKYVPELILHSIYAALPLPNEMAAVLDKGYFDLNSNNPIYRKNIETQVKTSWGSSPLALQDLLERTIDTPDGEREFDFSKNKTSEFTFSKAERIQALKPIIQQLYQFTFAQDLKLQTLVTLIKKYTQQEKIIIFCERHITAFYLEQALKQLFPKLKVFSTIVKKSQPNQNFDKQYTLKNSKEIEVAIEKFAPIANNVVGKYEETYNIFIATDAYGIGVNMQDASVVINYDLAWTPIEPIQRAGRILRLWDSPRKVQVYTFIPTLLESTNLKYELLNIKQRWEKLMVRHSQSKKIIDLPVLTANTEEEIYMPDVAPEKVVIESGSLKLDDADDKSVSPFFKDTAHLQMNRSYAEEINNDIISAKTYSGQNPLIFVLLKHNEKYYWPVYDPKIKQLREPTAPHLLDLIRANQETEIAWVKSELIEELSDACINAWCERHGIDEKEIIRECTLYLKPEGEGDAAPDWLNPPCS